MKSVFLSLLAFAITLPAQAGVISFYTDQATFNAALSSENSFDFNSLVSGSSAVSYSTSAGLTDNGINFVGNTGNSSSPYFLVAVGPDYFSNVYDVVPGQSVLATPASSSPSQQITNGSLTITLPGSGYTAFGLLLFDTQNGSTSPIGSDTVTLSVGTSSGSVTTPGGGTAFIGFTSASPVTSITLRGTTQDEFPDLSWVYYGTASTSPSAPEPATVSTLLLGAGLALLKLRKQASSGQSLARRSIE